jgi:hypothetical protein
MKLYRRGTDKTDVLTAMKEIIGDLDVYKTEGEYLDELLEREHGRAFDDAYDVGGRRRSAKFDHDKYLQSLYGGMIADAKRRNKKDVADALGKLREAAAVPASNE